MIYLRNMDDIFNNIAPRNSKKQNKMCFFDIYKQAENQSEQKIGHIPKASSNKNIRNGGQR